MLQPERQKTEVLKRKLHKASDFQLKFSSSGQILKEKITTSPILK